MKQHKVQEHRKQDGRLERTMKDIALDFFKQYPDVKHFSFVKEGYRYTYLKETDGIKHYSIEKYKHDQ